MNKKGQTAMEYLATYGWVIIMVIVIGVALWKFGVFDEPAQEINTCEWSCRNNETWAHGFCSVDDKGSCFEGIMEYCLYGNPERKILGTLSCSSCSEDKEQRWSNVIIRNLTDYQKEYYGVIEPESNYEPGVFELGNISFEEEPTMFINVSGSAPETQEVTICNFTFKIDVNCLPELRSQICEQSDD